MLFKDKINIAVKVLVIAFAALTYSACNDLPTEVGLPTDTLELTALSSLDDPGIILRSENFSVELPVVFGTGSALLGNTDLTSSTVFLGFATPPDTLGNRPVDNIVGPKLVLFFDRYAFGDSLSNFAFDIVRTMYEPPENVTWSWAYRNSEWPASDLYDISDPILQYSGNIGLQDTFTLELDFPAELVKEYLDITAERGDTFAFPQGEYPFGLALVSSPQNNQFRRLFTSFASQTDLNPKIRFGYQTPDSVIDIEMDAAISGQFLKPTAAEQGSIIVGSGIRRRSQLYFDLSQIPDEVSIISSSLWLYEQPEMNQFGNLSPDTIIVVDSLRDPRDSLVTVNSYIGRIDNGVLNIPTISAFITGWNLADRQDTLTLLPIRPVSRLDRFAFHSPISQDIDKRPKLVVIYQTRPQI